MKPKLIAIWFERPVHARVAKIAARDGISIKSAAERAIVDGIGAPPGTEPEFAAVMEMRGELAVLASRDGSSVEEAARRAIKVGLKRLAALEKNARARRMVGKR